MRQSWVLRTASTSSGAVVLDNWGQVYRAEGVTSLTELLRDQINQSSLSSSSPLLHQIRPQRVWRPSGSNSYNIEQEKLQESLIVDVDKVINYEHCDVSHFLDV